MRRFPEGSFSRVSRWQTMAVCALVALLVSIETATQAIAAESSTTYLLRATRVYPVSSAPIDNGQVLVRDGRIVAVGKELEVPADARVLDVAGTLVPGFVDCGSTLSVRGNAAEEFIEMTPEIRVLDTIDLDDVYLHDALLAGVTTVAVGPGDRNVIGGLGAIIRTAPSSLNDAIVREDAFLAVCITTVATHGNLTLRRAAPHSIYHRQPTTRMGTVFLARRAFFEALQLPVEDDPGDLQLRRPEDGSLRQILTSDGKQALRQTVESRRTIRVRADDKQEIVAALRIAEEFGLSVVLEGCVEAIDMIPQIARLKIDVLIAPGAHMSFYGDRDVNQVHDLARHLEAANVRFAFFSDMDWIVSYARELVALDIRVGLSEERALRAMTLDAARILGIDSATGSLDVGKEANLVALSGDPFASTSRVLWTMSSGKIWRDDITVPIETPDRTDYARKTASIKPPINEKTAQ